MFFAGFFTFQVPNARDLEFMGVWKRVEPEELTHTYFQKNISKNYSKNAATMKPPHNAQFWNPMLYMKFLEEI